MKTKLLFTALMGICLFGNNVFAQKAKKPARLTVTLKDKNIKTEQLKAPDIGRTKMKGNSKLTKERWLRLYTTINLTSQDTKAKWVDDLEVTWKVYLAPVTSGENKRRAILLEKTVSYYEAPLGLSTGLPITVFFRPSFIERYMKDGFKIGDIAVILEFKANGLEIKPPTPQGFMLTCGGKPPKKTVWAYTEERLHEISNPKMAIQSRAETPFKNLASSEFLTIKKEEN